MKTLANLQSRPVDIPLSATWLLTELAEMKGHQELFTRQSPQKFKTLREHAIIESAISSNRIEGVEIDRTRIKDVVLGKAHLRDRNEEEVRNYQRALAWIHRDFARISVTSATIRKLHNICKSGVDDAGRFKAKDGDIIETYPDGTRRVRFRTVSAAETPGATERLADLWTDLTRERRVPALILLAAFNLDFLCIHPFRDDNGRVSRLLLLLQLYHLGYEVGRYVSLERVIENYKVRYYETLEISSQQWHEGRHDPWAYIGYLLFILREAYRDFETRVGQLASPKGAKTELILASIDATPGKFTLVDIEDRCPGVSRDMVRKVLKDLKKAGEVRCLGRGPGAFWEKR